ncbi:ABC-type transport system substrate-binding protein [Bradyrhizobium yuanmingense]
MKMFRLAATAAAVLVSIGAAQAQTTLRIGLAEDPDILDPTMARTYVGRIVFSSFCDKLFDIDEKLNIVPQLGALERNRRRRQGAGHQAAARREIPRR